MIKINHLSKKFNDNVVLDDISLDIKKGDVVGIIGPSGTGKSTLLRCVNRLETPEKGTVTIGDKTIDLAENKPKDLLYLRQNTGMVFQRFNLFEKKTALENVMEGLIVVKKLPKDQAREIATEQLKLVGGTMGEPLSQASFWRAAAKSSTCESTCNETSDIASG